MNTTEKFFGISPYGALPSARQTAHLRDYGKKAFFHFGVNTFTNAEWGHGDERESLFNPTKTDVRSWVRAVKDAGFRLAILTAKHHDGFCLWPSRYTEHSIKNSPYKNGKGDLVREFTDACREYDIRAGIYLSPWDRHSPYWGSDEYSRHYNDQLTELLTDYGRIDEVWWDGAGSNETRYDWGLWAYTVRNLQPHAVIFGSMGATPFIECRWVGNEKGYAGDIHFPTIDAAAVENENTALLNSGLPDGDRFITAEVDVSIRPGWFYHAEQDVCVKSTKELVELWFRSIGRSAMMLLNFPPDRRGLLCDTDVENAMAAHRIITQTFADNLARGATVVADSVYSDDCRAEWVTSADYDRFYAAAQDKKNAILTFHLPKAETFDCFAVGETIELGIRVTGFRVEAMVEGSWKVLADKKSMGYLRAEHFEPVTSDLVRLVVYEASAAPILREFGLYKMPDEYYKAAAQKISFPLDLARTTTARISDENGARVVRFGGIFPFNTVSFCGNGVGAYRIEAFDGSRFHTLYEGTAGEGRVVVRLAEAMDGAYQIRIVTGREDNSSLDVSVKME